MNLRIGTARRAAVGMMTVSLMAAGIAAAGSASATTIKTGYGKINHDGLAVGTNIDPTTGIAAGQATFTWDLTSGVTELNITGKFSAINRSGVPVRLNLDYYTGLSGTGSVVSSHHTTGFTPSSGSLVVRNLNWTPSGAIGVQSAKLCVASDADRNGVYTSEACITSTL